MTQMSLSSVAGLGLMMAVTVSTASAQVGSTAGDPKAGLSYALRNCTSCHVVMPRQATPPRVANAPSFSAIAKMRSTTEMSLQAFLSTPHPNMPNFIVAPNDATDVIAYILSLRGRP